MKKLALLFMATLALNEAMPQVDIQYQVPDNEILELADVPAPTYNLVTDKGDLILQLERDQFKSIVELSEKEMRLGGLRINPKTNISSRVTYFKSISVLKVGDKEAVKVSGLPQDGRFTNFRWSPNQDKIALTHTLENGVVLYVVDLKSATAKKVSNKYLNANIGSPILWLNDGETLLIKTIPDTKKALIEKSETVPTGPRVSVNNGSKAQNRTYQDLLKDKSDEFNFEQLTTSEIYKVSLNGDEELLFPAAMYRGFWLSPDGKNVMLADIQKPFSYIVPYSRFPFNQKVYDLDANLVADIYQSPLIEELPKGFMAVKTGKRGINWRNDKPSSLVWVEALDEGDPEKEVDFRDAVYQLDFPFNGNPQVLVKTKTRYAGITWGSSGLAVVRDYWWNTRTVRTSFFDPSNSSKATDLIWERNYQDRYNDPGEFVTEKNEFNQDVLAIKGANLYLRGEGYSEDGIRPFVDEFKMADKSTKRLWRAEGKDYLEEISSIIDIEKGEILTRIEAQNKYPNYYLRNIKSKKKAKQITFNKNPFEKLEEVSKEVITYKRADGLELSATLYLPAGYDKKSGEKLPMLMWAYPEEFKDKATAAQVTSSKHEFIYPWYGSPIFWVNKGYAILDDASFPIVGEGEKEPNDNFIKQLVSNAKAAIDAVDEMGYIDRNKVAVGGHSYGAFMTANLLTHSNLFAAGIARSGAYNRTLTPFGFQSEERNYWEAPEIYYEMSPFMHADKMKHPLLLIHGEADNNSGTYPMQSERYFNALKGLGATVRLVILPKESHGYSARESILHMLWEQDQWLEKYVKGQENNEASNVDKDEAVLED